MLSNKLKSMPTLNTFSESRDNNFNLIRFGAALGVFFSHCFPLAGFGYQGKEYLLGFVCLNVFFIVSGYLVTKSYMDCKNIKQFFWSRILRIFPALFLAVLYSTFIIGLLFTTLPLGQYLSNLQVYLYFVKNIALLVPDIPSYLPGVFESNIYNSEVNSPLWSLPYEVFFYIVIGLLAYVSSAKKNIRAFSITISLLLLICYAIFVTNYSTRAADFALPFNKEAYRLASFFLLGVVFYLFRSKIVLSHWIMLSLYVLIGISTFYHFIFVAVTYCVLVYTIFYLAYIPAGRLRSFNRLGDYSYGIYIFGYPTQQAISTAYELPFFIYCVVTFLITLTLAVLSWHWVEKRALSYKNLHSSKSG